MKKIIIGIIFLLSNLSIANAEKLDVVFKGTTGMDRKPLEEDMAKAEIGLKYYFQNFEGCNDVYVKTIVHSKSSIIDVRRYAIVVFSPSCPDLKEVMISSEGFNNIFDKGNYLTVSATYKDGHKKGYKIDL